MTRMRSLLCGFLAVAFLLAIDVRTADAQSNDSLRIAAVVNDDLISAYDLGMRIEMVIALSNLSDRAGIRKQLAPEVLRTLITEKLRLQAAEELGVEVDPQEIEKAIADIETRNNLKPRELFTFFDQRRLDVESLVQQLRAEIAWSRSVFRKYGSSVSVSDSEIDAAVERAEAALGKPEYDVYEIYLGVDDPGKDAEVRAQAQRLIDQLRSGASFPSLAQSFSQSSTAPRGGSVGWVRTGDMPEEVVNQLSAMQPGTVAGPIGVTGGYYIVLLRSKRIAGQRKVGNSTVTLSQLHLPLASDAPDDTAANVIAAVRQRTAGISDCAAFEELGKQIGSPLSGALGVLPLDRLPPDLRNAVANLPANDVTPPIRREDAVVVLMVCERSEPETETVEVDREAISDRLMDQRLGIYARQFMRDLRRNAYIEIR